MAICGAFILHWIEWGARGPWNNWFWLRTGTGWWWWKKIRSGKEEDCFASRSGVLDLVVVSLHAVIGLCGFGVGKRVRGCDLATVCCTIAIFILSQDLTLEA